MSLALAPQLNQAIIKGIADELELDLRWDAFAKTTLQQERKMKPAIRAQFSNQEEDVLRRVNNNPPPIVENPADPRIKAPSDIYESWLFKPEEWTVLFEQAARPYIEASVVEGAEESIAAIGQALDITIGIDFDVRDPRIEQLINEKLHKFSFEVNSETTRLLKAEFAEAIREGESIPLIRKRVEKVFGFSERVRTQRIARTEIIGTHNRGKHEGMVASGVVESKRWLATRDNRTRDSHRDIDGEVVKLEEEFSNGLLHPGDWNGAASEIINCRCTTIVEDFVF